MSIKRKSMKKELGDRMNPSFKTDTPNTSLYSLNLSRLYGQSTFESNCREGLPETSAKGKTKRGWTSHLPTSRASTRSGGRPVEKGRSLTLSPVDHRDSTMTKVNYPKKISYVD